jgi:hypothetical protein
VAIDWTEENRKREEQASMEEAELNVDLSPPSPFLNGWQSVNPQDYPHFIPTRQKQQTGDGQNKDGDQSTSVGQAQTAAPMRIRLQVKNPPQELPKAPIPASKPKYPRLALKDLHTTTASAPESQKPSRNETENTTTQATHPPQNRRNSKQDTKSNPPSIFLPKAKIPKIRKPVRKGNTSAAEGETNTPLFKPASQPTSMDIDGRNDLDDPCVGFLFPLVLILRKEKVNAKKKQKQHLF